MTPKKLIAILFVNCLYSAITFSMDAPPPTPRSSRARPATAHKSNQPRIKQPAIVTELKSTFISYTSQTENWINEMNQNGFLDLKTSLLKQIHDQSLEIAKHIYSSHLLPTINTIDWEKMASTLLSPLTDDHLHQDDKQDSYKNYNVMYEFITAVKEKLDSILKSNPRPNSLPTRHAPANQKSPTNQAHRATT